MTDENALSSVVLGYGDTVKEFTDDENLYNLSIHFRSFLARLATDEDEKWQDSDTFKKCTASFYDADKKLICKFVMNGYIEDDNRHQLMFYDDEDTKGVQYAVNKKAVDYFLEFAKRGFNDW